MKQCMFGGFCLVGFFLLLNHVFQSREVLVIIIEIQFSAKSEMKQ